MQMKMLVTMAMLCLAGCVSAWQREVRPGDQAVMLPVAEHGEPLTENAPCSRYAFLTLPASGTNSVPLDGVVSAMQGAPLHGEMRCYIKADARCRFKEFSDLLDLCSRSGVCRFSVVARSGTAMQDRGGPQLLALAFLRPCLRCPEEERFADGFRVEIAPSRHDKGNGVVVWCGKCVLLAELDSELGWLANNPSVGGGKGVCLKCCESAPYKTFVNVLEVLYKHGFKRVSVFTLSL